MGHMAEGHHVAKITATALGTTDKGTVQAAISLKNDAGDTAVKYLYFSEKAKNWTKKQLKSCGFTGDDVSAIHDSPLLVGNVVEFDVEVEVYEGDESLKVGMLFPEGGSSVLSNKMTAEEAKEFGAKLKGMFGGAKGDGAADLGDIPFAPDPVF